MVKILDLSEQEITKLLGEGKITIAVYGIGKMGLPIAAVFANEGAKVIGVDINPKFVNGLNKGVCYIEGEPDLEDLIKKSFKERRISATSDQIQASRDSDVKIILVPTFLDQSKKPDLSALIAVAENIGKGLSKGDLVIIESTVPPLTTRNVIKPILERNSNLSAFEDFGLVFSPERVMSGSVIADIKVKYPKLIGGITERSTSCAAAIYSIVSSKGVIRLKNAETAEAAKVFDGIYRDVNIALANELAIFSEHIGVDIIETIQAANTQPYSHIHTPGAGVGGHCIPYYPYFVIDVAKERGIKLTLTENARNRNEAMPIHMVKLVKNAFKQMEKRLIGSRITILGLTFRGNVKEYRNTPATQIIKELKDLQVNVTAFDPLLSEEEIRSYFKIDSAPTLEDSILNSDCLVVVSAHKEFKEIEIGKLAKKMNKPAALIDGRHVFDPKKVIASGLIYRGVGRVS